MSGSELKREVLQKHRGRTAKEAFLAEFSDEEDPDRRIELAKAAPQGQVQTTSFEAVAGGSVGTLWKSDDDFVVWGPASVEIVDKENDRIKASALEEALPQLMKRQALSYEHSDQIVGKILDKFETEEPVEVEIGDQSIKRQEFPTDVLDDELDEPAMFVAGNVYGDTKKSREVREEIEKGNIDSYSISGEAIVTSMAVEGGKPVTDISKIDLSAVTLANEGMNQKAKFGVVKKAGGPSGPSADAPLGPLMAKSILTSKTMSKEDDQGENPLTKSGMESILDKHLPDGELATKEDVESIARETAEDVVKENATNTGSPDEGEADRPSGEGGGGTEADPEYEGDNVDEAVSDSDKVEEKSAFSMSELKSALPDDQFKAIKPTLEAKMGPDGTGDGDGLAEMPEDDEEDDLPEPPADEGAELEEVEPEMEEEDEQEDLLVAGNEKAKALGLSPNNLTDDQRRALAKADVSGLDEVDGVTGPLGDTTPGTDDSDVEKSGVNADTTMAGSNFFDSDGGVKL